MDMKLEPVAASAFALVAQKWPKHKKPASSHPLPLRNLKDGHQSALGESTGKICAKDLMSSSSASLARNDPLSSLYLGAPANDFSARRSFLVTNIGPD